MRAEVFNSPSLGVDGDKVTALQAVVAVGLKGE
jgi:hypothetical protein